MSFYCDRASIASHPKCTSTHVVSDVMTLMHDWRKITFLSALFCREFVMLSAWFYNQQFVIIHLTL